MKGQLGLCFVALLSSAPFLLAAAHTSSSSSSSASGALAEAVNGATKRPNILFIMTDDQDLHMDSLNPKVMPRVNDLLINAGTYYRKHYCTVAICCPSRVNLWTGRAAQDVTPLPTRGYPKFISEGLNDNYLPVWLQAAGFNTYYVGKLMNSHSTKTYNNPFPGGWNNSHFLLEPGTYDYTNSTWSYKNSQPISYPGLHTTDLTSQNALGLLEEAVKSERPFFLAVAPIAPHGFLNDSGLGPPIPQEKYKDAFPNARVPRTPDFNPHLSSGASWIKTLPIQNSTVVKSNDAYYRARLQTLAGIDDMVNDLVAALDKHNVLDSTYIIYTTDNGFHIGQHRLNPGKTCGFETDINIPLIIRGPGVPSGKITDLVSSHTDLAPTFFEILGIPLRSDFDGTPIPLTGHSIAANHRKSEHVNVEFWGIAGRSEGRYGAFQVPQNNTYKSVRVSSEQYNLYYSVWCTNEHELYDLNTDPYQMTNLLASTSPTNAGERKINGYTVSTVASRLDALLLVLKSCKATTCTFPWRVLHPKGDVHNFRQALNPQYDAFYLQQQAKVSFSECALGHLIEFEGPQDALSYQAAGPRADIHWSEFT